MKREMLIKKLEEEYSLVEFYKNKDEILRHLRGESSEARKQRRDELKGMPMKELREIGDRLGAKDTSKTELTEEILDKEGL